MAASPLSRATESTPGGAAVSGLSGVPGRGECEISGGGECGDQQELVHDL